MSLMQILRQAEGEQSGQSSILKNDPFDDVAEVLSLPTSSLSVDKFDIVASYLNSTNEAIKDRDAPRVTWFSSLGPNFLVPEILKPDITAPGEEISAAYSPIVSPTSSSQDKRRVKYNILSGTSTSCLHAAGEAAYVKNFHPDWSASAIKSAIMTMGSFMVLLKKTTSKCDASKEDYIKMLCGLGYDERKLRHITGANSPCPKVSKKVLPRDLNYPSLTAMQIKDLPPINTVIGSVRVDFSWNQEGGNNPQISLEL
ncbi:subtilisin-like protease sbt4.6 [Quercus suber]|uniref:Subtilisin-like protease sbt4.6 n=1 Tax=Quercus suber TaxID=58331 RepID=A0AAW0JJ83_QUESU